MNKKQSSLDKKREKLILNGIIKPDLIENIKYQISQPHGFALNLCGHCTFRCSYCPQSTVNVPKEFIDMDIIKRLLNDAKDVPTYFQFGTRGENILHPDFFNIIAGIKENNRLHYITLNTNGLILSEDLALKVLRSGVDQLIFSLQTINPDLYTKLTNYQDFSKILNNVIQAIKLRDRNNIDVMIGVQFLNTAENKPYYDEFERFWNDYNVFTYSQTLHNWGDKFDFIEKVSIERYPCLYLWLYPNISHKGNVCSCFADFFDENKFGNLSQQSLSDIWTGSELRKDMIDKHLHSRWNELKLCKSCNGWIEFANVFKKDKKTFFIENELTAARGI